MPNKYYKYIKKGLPVIFCLHCGIKIQSSSSNQKYCLDEKCQKIKKTIQRRLARIKYLENNNLLLYKKCLVCEKKFSFQKHKKFCSKECYKRYNNKNNILNKKCSFCEKNFNTIYPNQKYCSIKCGKSNKMNLRIRFEVLKRDNFTCQYCGEKASKVKLHVDHIIPKSKGGNNNKNNLITACERCNLGKSNYI